jgi:hypothetical protein
MASKLSLPLPQSLRMMASHSHEVADVAEAVVVRDVVRGVISVVGIEGTSVVITEAASAVVCLYHIVYDIYSLEFSQATVVNAVSVVNGLNVVSGLNAVSVASGVAGLMVTGEATKIVDVVGDAGVDMEPGEVSN